MTVEEFLESILLTYKSTFDIYREYNLAGKEMLAYGYFCSHNEKYVLTRAARLWESNSYEHIFFLERSKLHRSDIEDMDKLIKQKIEPDLVCKGEQLPPKNHMYSYITIAFLVEESLDKDVKKYLSSYRYNHSYLFSFRGWCEVRMIAIDLHNKIIVFNTAARPLIKHYKSILGI